MSVVITKAEVLESLEEEYEEIAEQAEHEMNYVLVNDYKIGKKLRIPHSNVIPDGLTAVTNIRLVQQLLLDYRAAGWTIEDIDDPEMGKCFEVE